MENLHWNYYAYHFKGATWAQRKYYTAFKRQKSHAIKRGIYFRFTFEEWTAWWEENLGPDWFKKRGRRKGQYVMARFEDKGIYTWWNVRCATVEENRKDLIGRKYRK